MAFRKPRLSQTHTKKLQTSCSVTQSTATQSGRKKGADFKEHLDYPELSDQCAGTTPLRRAE